jgi:hypothetical protein
MNGSKRSANCRVKTGLSSRRNSVCSGGSWSSGPSRIGAGVGEPPTEEKVSGAHPHTE